MPERETPPEYQATSRPENPPNSVVNRPARNAVVGAYLGPLIILFVIFGFGLLYWSYRGPSAPDRDTTHVGVGTTGENGPGAFNPRPRPNSTRDELEFRGGGDAPITNLGDLTKNASFVAGRHVDVNDVEVESVQGNAFWVRDAGSRVEVIAPDGSSLPSKGAHVHIFGTAEGSGREAARIRASSITSK
jgi:hypothetical protein